MNSSRFTDYDSFRRRLINTSNSLAFNLKPTQTWIFTDESGTHSGSRYFGIGGLFVWHGTASGGNFGVGLQNMCKSRNWTDEFKWSKISNGNMHRYREFVNFFFARPKTVQFHSILIDRSLLTQGDSHSTETLFKFYYSLLRYRINPTASWRPSRRSILIPDRMALPENHWSRLFYSVNVSLRNHFGIRHYPLVQIAPTDSKICLEIQLTDVLLGSIVSKQNNNFASQHKQQFAEEVSEKLADCDRTKASIWNWQPKKISSAAN